MIKKFFTLSLVAAALAGFSMVAVQQPSEAHGNCQGNGNQFGSSNQFLNTAANRYSLNNGNGFYRNGMNSAYGNPYYNNQSASGMGFQGNRIAHDQKKALKQQRKLMRQQQMAAAGIPFGNNGYNNGLLSNVSNRFGMNGGNCNQNASAAYSQGYQAGVNSAGNSLYNNGYGYGNGNGLAGLNGLGGINGLNGIGGINGLNGIGGLGLANNGSGVSSILGRVLNGF